MWSVTENGLPITHSPYCVLKAILFILQPLNCFGLFYTAKHLPLFQQCLFTLESAWNISRNFIWFIPVNWIIFSKPFGPSENSSNITLSQEIYRICVSMERSFLAQGLCVFFLPQRLFLLEDRDSISVKMEDPEDAVEFRDATLAWEKARPPQGNGVHPQTVRKTGGMRRVLRREKLSLYIISEEEKNKDEGPNAQHLLTHMEQESPQSTISSTQSMRPLLQKTLHRIHLHIRKVPPRLRPPRCIKKRSLLGWWRPSG